MFPPSQGLRLDIDAISQIFGSISIACWIGTYSMFVRLLAPVMQKSLI
jgi:hypothetical protein